MGNTLNCIHKENVVRQYRAINLGRWKKGQTPFVRTSWNIKNSCLPQNHNNAIFLRTKDRLNLWIANFEGRLVSKKKMINIQKQQHVFEFYILQHYLQPTLAIKRIGPPGVLVYCSVSGYTLISSQL